MLTVMFKHVMVELGVRSSQIDRIRSLKELGEVCHSGRQPHNKMCWGRGLLEPKLVLLNRRARPVPVVPLTIA
jgi:hypothetical protein